MPGAAVLAQQAGFHFVDIKHCHGYLLHELLSARERPGPYGGDLAGRASSAPSPRRPPPRPGLALAVRLSAFDFAPFMADAEGIARRSAPATMRTPSRATAPASATTSARPTPCSTSSAASASASSA